MGLRATALTGSGQQVRARALMNVLIANIDIGLGVVIGVLSAIRVAAVIYVAESELFAELRLKLSRKWAAHIPPGHVDSNAQGPITYRYDGSLSPATTNGPQRQAEASLTRPSSASEASIGWLGSTRTV